MAPLNVWQLILSNGSPLISSVDISSAGRRVSQPSGPSDPRGREEELISGHPASRVPHWGSEQVTDSRGCRKIRLHILRTTTIVHGKGVWTQGDGPLWGLKYFYFLITF